MSTEATQIPKAIADFKADRTVENVLVVLDLLRDSTVWIPCTAKLDQADLDQLAEMLVDPDTDMESMAGKTFQAKEKIRLVPDILQNADGFYFPVFSTCEEMGEYGEHFSKIEKSFAEAIVLAKNNDRELVGIVVNAFTDPMVLPWDIVKIVEENGEERKGADEQE